MYGTIPYTACARGLLLAPRRNAGMATTLFPSLIPEDLEGELDDDPFAESGCSICDEYEGDHPENHARNAHPDEYETLTED